MLCSMYARQTLAVASGRKEIISLADSSFADSDDAAKVYISFETMSVSPPTARANNSVGSKIGGRISPKPKLPNTERAVFSAGFPRFVTGGRRARVARMGWDFGRWLFFGAASDKSFSREDTGLGPALQKSKKTKLPP